MAVDANKICDEIIRNVSSSNLNYRINQTPYSVYLTIRKKFIKEFEPNHSEPKIVSEENPKYVSDLEKENVYIKNEYDKLARLYNACLQHKTSLESEVNSLGAEFVRLKEAEEEKVCAEVKKVIHEKKNIETKYEKVLKENKDFKSEVSDLKREKNALNVAIKASKKEMSEQNKRSDAKIRELEKKVVELSEYRMKRLSEDRELKIKQKKDLKKATKTQLSNSIASNNNCVIPKNSTFNNPNSMPLFSTNSSMNTNSTSYNLSPQLSPEKSNISTILVSSAAISSNLNSTLTNTELTTTSISSTFTSTSMSTASCENLTAQPKLMTDEYFFEKYLKPLQEGIQLSSLRQKNSNPT